MATADDKHFSAQDQVAGFRAGSKRRSFACPLMTPKRTLGLAGLRADMLWWAEWTS